MATVKKSKKKKIIIPICLALVVAIIAGSAFGYSKSKNTVEVSLHTISTDDINESVSLTGKVTSGAIKEYKVSAIATVKEVYVKVGDEVKQNDVLATFDVTSVDGQIASLQASYNEALISYDNAVVSQQDAQVKADAIKNQINKIEASIGAMENSSASSQPTTQPTTQPSTTQPSDPTISADGSTLPGVSYSTGADIIYQPGVSPNLPAGDIVSIGEQLEDLNNTLTNLTLTMDQLLQTTTIIANDLAFITETLENLDIDKLSQTIVDDLVASGIAESMAREIVSSIDFEGFAKTLANSSTTQLTAAQIQLLSLQGQYAIFNTQANGASVKAQKKMLDSTKEALDLMKAQKEELSAGWRAAFDGVVTAVDIYDGMQTSLLTTGITIENLDSMMVTVSLSEYDYHKVRVGMPAVITTAYGSYDGEVATIAPTATGGSSSSMLDSVGDMAGISGLSSLTDSGAGVMCTVSIPKTDANIIAGFDANVEIKTGEYNGVLVVPIESIVLEKAGSYVYLYNEEEGTVTKTQIETGAISDSAYEVKSGLKPGDRIISAPATNYKEDTFSVKVK